MWLILIKDYLKYINLMIIGFFEIYYPQFPFNLNLWASVMFSRSFRKNHQQSIIAKFFSTYKGESPLPLMLHKIIFHVCVIG